MQPFTIKPAAKKDLFPLLGMIRELAIFERMAHELEVTADSLREAFFGPQPVAAALLARVGKEPAGYAVYYRAFSTFVGRSGIFLDDLYVRPQFRKRGIGLALIRHVAHLAAKLGGRFEWIALRWNKNALNFYKKLGAKAMNDWVLLRMSGQGVRKLIYAAK